MSIQSRLYGGDADLARMIAFLEAANAAYAPIPLTRQSPTPRILGTVVGVYQDRRRRR